MVLLDLLSYSKTLRGDREHGQLFLPVTSFGLLGPK